MAYYIICYVIKQVLHGLPLNIKIYSHEESNIQRREEKLSIISPRVNKFDVQAKSMQHLLYIIPLFKKNE